MPLESKLYTVLSGSSALSTLIGGRIYPLHRVQSGATPSLVYSRVSGLRENSIRGYVGLENARIEINIYTTSVDELRTIGAEAVSAMTETTVFTGVCQDAPFDNFDDTLQLYRRVLEFSVWNRE